MPFSSVVVEVRCRRAGRADGGGGEESYRSVRGRGGGGEGASASAGEGGPSGRACG
jgi:hypothetical protein